MTEEELVPIRNPSTEEWDVLSETFEALYSIFIDRRLTMNMDGLAYMVTPRARAIIEGILESAVREQELGGSCSP